LNDLTISVLGDGTIIAKFSSHVELAIVQMVLSIATVLIATTIFVAPNMPCALTKTFAVVLNDIEFHADRRVIGLNVAVSG